MKRDPFAPTERAYLFLTLTLLVLGWWALVLAELGRFSPLLAFLPLPFLGVWLGRRLGWGGVPRPPSPEGVLWGAILLIAFLLSLPPFELVLGGKDAGVYPNTAYAIVRTGGIVQEDPIVASLSYDAAEEIFLKLHPDRFLYRYQRLPGFYVTDLAKGRVLPQFLHLYPAVLALGVSLLGLRWGLAVQGLLALLGTWGYALLARRLFGRRTGLLTLAAFALFLPQVWFGRYPVSETLSQALLAFALYATVRLLEGDDPAFWGLWAGIAWGETALVRADFLFTLPWPLLLLAYRRWVHRQPGTGRALLAAGALLVHAIVHILTLSTGYVLDLYFHIILKSHLAREALRPFLPERLQDSFRRLAEPIFPSLASEAVAVGLVLIALTLLLARGRERLRRGEAWIARRGAPLGAGLAGAFLLLALWAYTLRAGLPDREMLLHPLANLLRWQAYIGALTPLGPAANLIRLGWYLSPLGLWLGLIGVARWLRRPSWPLLPFLGLGLLQGILFVHETYGFAHHFYIARRYLPVVFPTLLVGMAALLADLSRRRPRGLRGAVVVLAALQLLYLAYTLRPILRHVEYRGALDQIGALAREIEPEAVLLFVDDRDPPSLPATPLTYAFGRHALVVAWPRPGSQALADQVARWTAEGRPVYLAVGPNGGRLTLPGWRPADTGRTFRLEVPEFQQLYLQKPHVAYTIRLRYRLYRLVPRAPGEGWLPPAPWRVDVGTDGDIALLSGWHHDEVAGDGTTYAWTYGEAALHLPPAPGGVLRIRMSAGRSRPPSLGPARVQVYLGEVLLGEVQVDRTFRTYTFELPAFLPQVDADGGVTVRIVTEPWVPAEVDPRQVNDRRQLGVQVDWVEVEPEGGEAVPVPHDGEPATGKDGCTCGE